MIMQSLNNKELFELHITQTRHTILAVWTEMSKFNTPQSKRKYPRNVHKIDLQCVNNHYAKLEYKGMNTVGVADYTL